MICFVIQYVLYIFLCTYINTTFKREFRKGVGEPELKGNHSKNGKKTPSFKAVKHLKLSNLWDIKVRKRGCLGQSETPVSEKKTQLSDSRDPMLLKSLCCQSYSNPDLQESASQTARQEDWGWENTEDRQLGPGGLAYSKHLCQVSLLISISSYILFTRREWAKVSRMLNQTMLAKRKQDTSDTVPYDHRPSEGKAAFPAAENLTPSRPWP